ncbi:hypothetical protein EIP86_006462 [Pleurotus ostreatoroseus]|nr:hypothetical protein EIP86_006462 [Pleurotus ostreatoroseus]
MAPQWLADLTTDFRVDFTANIWVVGFRLTVRWFIVLSEFVVLKRHKRLSVFDLIFYDDFFYNHNDFIHYYIFNVVGHLTIYVIYDLSFFSLVFVEFSIFVIYSRQLTVPKLKPIHPYLIIVKCWVRFLLFNYFKPYYYQRTNVHDYECHCH